VTKARGRDVTHRIDVTGLGEIARHRHLPTIADHAAFDLAGVADPHGEFAGLGVPAFRSHAEMLAALHDLDAVAICTPPLARTRVALDAIAAGRNVLMEKPPTATVSELLLLRDAAAAAGVVLFTAWHSQHDDAVQHAKALLEHETVAHVAMTWREKFEQYHSGQEWVWRPGGFGVFDAGINGLSILTRILPQRAYVRAGELPLLPGDDTPIAARVEFAIGAAGSPGEAHLDWRHEGPALREITLTTRAGTVLHLAESGGRLLVNGDVVLASPRREYPDLYDHFDRLLRAGT
jgi:D-galactose 1-dehydrogenase